MLIVTLSPPPFAQMSAAKLVGLVVISLLRLAVVIVAFVRPGARAQGSPKESSPPVEVAYVIEPFETLEDPFEEWYADGGSSADSLELSNSVRWNNGSDGNVIPIEYRSAVLFGRNSLAVDYTLGATTASSSVADEELNLTTTTTKNSSSSSSFSFVEFGKIQLERPHNCHGATRFSMWYQHEQPATGGAAGRQMRVSVLLYDDTEPCLLSPNKDCAPPSQEDLERFRVMTGVIPSRAASQFLPDWHQLQVSVDDLPASLNLRRLRGWAVRLEGSLSSQSTSGTLRVDQLECVGGGDIFGAAFHLDTTFQDAVVEGTWKEEYFQSNTSRQESAVGLTDGLLDVEYSVEKVETWGGFVGLFHIATGTAYYNLTYGGQQNNHIALNYRINEPASITGPTIVRFVLLDGSHCTSECDFNHHEHERYYSFHKILDLTGEDAAGQLQIPLIASQEPGDPFWFTWWAGIAGNRELDLADIKGFILEFVVDETTLEMGDLVRGAADFSKLTVMSLDEPGGGYFGVTEECVLEPTLFFDVEDTPTYFKRNSFVGNKCCQICAAEPVCLYAVTNGVDCYTSHSESSGLVGNSSSDNDFDFSFVKLLNVPEGSLRRDFQSYWMDDVEKRGSYCDLCSCIADQAMIDCRDANLHIPPKHFNETWKPRSLDLRENPELFLLGEGSLLEIASDLEEIYLPLNLRHFSSQLLQESPRLVKVHFEQFEVQAKNGKETEEQFLHRIGAGTTLLNNAIVQESGAFSDVCCSRGVNFDTQTPAGGLTFCDVHPDAPGIDSTTQPFVEYFDARIFLSIFPTSQFLSEAAESWQKCAAYCQIFDDECSYWNYDGRIVNTDNRCLLLSDNGTIKEFVCCDPDHYADENQTVPGWMAGTPPQTRHIVDKAAVQIRVGGASSAYIGVDGIVQSDDLVASPETSYTAEYELSLGSTPLRGAVWIEPRLSTSGSSLRSLDSSSVTIWPSRIVLYDSIMTGMVTVTVDKQALQPGESGTLILQNEILACDEAFLSQADDHLVYIQAVGPPVQTNTSLVLAITFPVLVLLILLITAGVYVILEVNRRKNDSVWKIDPHELHFAKPPHVVGQGTFGMVLQAEYRGTQVAVKRVIAPQTLPHKSSQKLGKPGLAFPFEFFSIKDAKPVSEKGAPLEAAPRGSNSWGGLALRSVESGTRNGDIEKGKRRSAGGSSTRQAAARERERWRKARADFITEMRYLSKLRHPCITTVMGAVIDWDLEPMMVMELMDHGSLFDCLHNETMLIDDEIVLPILQDVSQGLRFLHAAEPQVIHGDLKAANILVDAKFRGKVADFGLSDRKGRSANRSKRRRRESGGSKLVTGTPFWMAPELLRGESSNTTASDVYSFGVIIFECFSRQEPYQGDPSSFKEILDMVASRKINKRPSPVPTDCPPLVKQVMDDCFKSDASKRPTAVELNTRLKAIEPRVRETPQQHLTLYDVFPKRVADALREGRPVEPEHRDCVTIFFSDIVGFTNISAAFSSPSKVADMLGRLYGKFDQLSEQHNIFKVETIGDAYMAVTNLVEDQPDDHAKRIAMFAIDAIKAANATLIDTEEPDLGFVNIRVGFHSGPVVADVVGSRNPRYCLFGDTVNTASRMESNSIVNRIHCSPQAAEILRDQCPRLSLTSRGIVNIKGKGDMETWWVTEPSVSMRRLTKDREELLKAMKSMSNLNDSFSLSSSHLRRSTTLSGIEEEGEEQPPLAESFSNESMPSKSLEQSRAAVETAPSSGTPTEKLEPGNGAVADGRNGDIHYSGSSMKEILVSEAQRKRDKIRQLENGRQVPAGDTGRNGEHLNGEQLNGDHEVARIAL